MDHVVQVSGGMGSYFASRRVIDKYGPDDVTLLFADVKMEDEDLYRFLDDIEEDLGVPITRISEGRDPWEVFKDVKYLGNTRIDPCSRVLKRDFLRDYMERNFDPDDTTVYIGIDWTEEHRFVKAKPRWEPWTLAAPLCEAPYLDKDSMREELERRGIAVPRLYEMGFPHNNCGGFCVKAGQAHFKILLEKMPERYAHHERKEQELREFLGKDVAVLRERSRPKIMARLGLTEDDVDKVISVSDCCDDDQCDEQIETVVGYTIRATGEPLPKMLPKTFAMLREEVESETDDTDPFDLGGCGCAL